MQQFCDLLQGVMQIIKNLRFNLNKCKFTKFPRGHAPDPPRFGMLLHSSMFALHNMGMHFSYLN